MSQNEKWQAKYDEVMDFIKTNKRNPIPEQARPLLLCWLAAIGTQEPVAFRSIGLRNMTI